jgi:hypothetical protein
MMVVVTMAVAMPVIIMRSRCVSITTGVMMIDRIAAWVARMRAHECDQSGEDRADQRQKNDCLDHAPAS